MRIATGPLVFLVSTLALGVTCVVAGLKAMSYREEAAAYRRTATLLQREAIEWRLKYNQVTHTNVP